MYLCIYIPTSFGFSVIALLVDRDLIKKKEKGAIHLRKKMLLDKHMWNVMPQFQSSRLNGVATIALTYIDTYIDTYIQTSCRT